MISNARIDNMRAFLYSNIEVSSVCFSCSLTSEGGETYIHKTHSLDKSRIELFMKEAAPGIFDRRRISIFVAIVIGLVIVVKNREAMAPDSLAWSGQTMGTTYSIKAVNDGFSEVEFESLKIEVDELLEEINEQMSTYREKSEISRFNRSRSLEPFDVSPSFGYVVEKALVLSQETVGAFDPTLDPLINLWGFGNRNTSDELPSAREVERALEGVGFGKVVALSRTSIQKKIGSIQLNLNAIAKGHGVDLVSELLFDKGLLNTMVEIGGELRTRGFRLDGTAWRIGIETPDSELFPGESLQATVDLSEKAMATSGSYRNFVLDEEGNVVSHIIDPRTGHPVSHRLASVSVISDTCIRADGVATALFVMGVEEGLAWVDAHDDVEALFLVSNGENGFQQVSSSGFVNSPVENELNTSGE